MPKARYRNSRQLTDRMYRAVVEYFDNGFDKKAAVLAAGYMCNLSVLVNHAPCFLARRPLRSCPRVMWSSRGITHSGPFRLMKVDLN